MKPITHPRPRPAYQSAARAAHRRRSGVLGAAAAAVAVFAGLPVATIAADPPPAAAQAPVSLAGSGVTSTGATLTITGHTGVWHYRRHPATHGPCSSEVAAGTSTAAVTGLTPATAYTFKAYSDEDCSTELTALATDAEFTTPGIVLSAANVDVVEGSTASYTVELATQPTSDVTVTVTVADHDDADITVDANASTAGDQNSLTFTSTDYGAKTVTVSAAHDPPPPGSQSQLRLRRGRAPLTHTAVSGDLAYQGASAHNVATALDDEDQALAASSVASTSATLTLSNHAGAWYYRQQLPDEGDCSSQIPARTATASLTGLAPGTSYLFAAFSDSSCRKGVTADGYGARFTTPGVALSTNRLVVPESGTATYTVRLATAPATDTTVSIAAAGAADTDLTVDTDPNTDGNQDTLAFATTDWWIPRTVTVAAKEETANDTDHGTATLRHTAPGYTAAAAVLTATEGDNDVCKGTDAVGNLDSGGLVDDCNTLLAAKAMLAGTSTAIDNWDTMEAIGSWTGITLTNGRVTQLNLIRKDLDGAVPNTLGYLDELTALYLRGTDLTGPVPPELGSLTKLTSFDLSDNSLSGPVPSHLGNLTELTFFAINKNHLTGRVPPELGSLTKLTKLDLSNNSLTGPIPPELGRLTKLTNLSLDDNRLTGPIPAQIGSLTRLVNLNLDNNNLTGPIPASVGNLTALVGLGLFHNSLTGPIPTEIGSLAKLNQLLAYSNFLSGALPSEIGNLAKLVNLNLNSNNLSGAIPASIGRLTALGSVNLALNRLSGPIPAEIGSLETLSSLSLRHNDLSGPIPAEIGRLSNLASLYLNNNRLSGHLPASLDRLAEMDWLSLQNNRLSGAIPAGLGRLPKIRVLLLHGNQLTGSVPAEIGRAQYAYLHGNYLSGCLPPNAAAASRLQPNPQRAGVARATCNGIELSVGRTSVGENRTGTYSARLTSAPMSDVTVTISRTGDSDITFDTDTNQTGFQSTLTFTTQNWGTWQQVELSAAQDADGIAGSAELSHVAASSDTAYDGATSVLPVAENEDDAALGAVLVTATSAELHFARSGATRWKYRRESPAQGSCLPASTNSYIYGQSVRAPLTGLTPNTSYSYKAYSDSACATELTADATDAEFTTASGVLASQTHLAVGEGDSATFSVELATQPSADVTVTVARTTGGDSDLTFSPATLTFSTSTWSTAQEVTVSAAADADTANGTATLTLTPAGTDAAYDSGPAEVAVAERDDDAVLSVYTSSATGATLVLANHAGTWHYQQSQPSTGACSAPVSGGLVGVTLAGLAPSTSYTYKAYSDSACATELTTDDTDAEFGTGAEFAAPAVVLSASQLVVPEGGARSYEVRLATAPDADVTVTVTRDEDGDADLSADTDPDAYGVQSSLTFTVSNWSTPQTVRISAAEETDPSDTANGVAAFSHNASPAYTADVATLDAAEADNDACPGSAAVGGAHVISGGLVEDCTALLGAKAALAGTSAALAGWSTDLAMSKWQGLTVSGGRVTRIRLPSLRLDGVLPAVLGSLGALVSLDLSSNSLSGPIPEQIGNLTALDTLRLHGNELSGCVPPNLVAFVTAGAINPQAGNADVTVCRGIVVSDAHPVVAEGSSATYTVRLATRPAAAVTVTLSAAAPTAAARAARSEAGLSAQTQTADSDITFSPTTLAFTVDNWDVEQTVTVSAAQDDDGTSTTVVVTHTAASTGDPVYEGLSTDSRVSESDDDLGLTAAYLTRTGATLTLSFHDEVWHYRQEQPTQGDCSKAIAAGTTSVRVEELAAGTSYTFKAYSDSTCSADSELTTDDTDAEFTTLAPPRVPGTSASPGSGVPTGDGSVARAARPIRLSGEDRYATATAAAAQFVRLAEGAGAASGARRQVDTVIVASGQAFPDALAASALARTLRAPVLLTPKAALDENVEAFISRHRIARVVIVGGPAAVTEDVEAALAALPGIDSVTRHAGADRYATAALVAHAVGTPGALCGTAAPTVIVTTGQNFPDALVAGPLAYRGRHPIVLTAADRLPQAAADYLAASGAKQAVVIGGPAAVSEDVVAAVEALGLEASRVSGSDRSDTSVRFARRFSTFSGPSCFRRSTIGLATGWAFPDALAAAAVLGHSGAPLLLTSPDGVPQTLIDYAASGRLTRDFELPPIVTIGGRTVVPADHPTKLLAALPR